MGDKIPILRSENSTNKFIAHTNIMTGVFTNEHIGIKIRELRKLRKLTQNDLANMVGINKRYIGSMERGEVEPSFKRVKALLEVMDYELSVVLLKL